METHKRLTHYDRERIASLLLLDFKPAQIAKRLGRHRSVITREIRNNQCSQTGYSAYAAQQKSQKRALGRKKSRYKLRENAELWKLVRKKLKLKWSPQQISGYLRRHYAHRPDMQISHESIYHFIFVLPRGELKKSLLKCLRQQKSKRGRRNSELGSRNRIPNMVSIHDRPEDIEGRQIPGHWEGDLMMGKNNQSALGTLVERQTRLTLLVPLDYQNSDYVCLSFANRLSNLPERLRKSMTYDQGRELSHHESFTALSKASVYFCDPHSPWQRGTNENTNGLLRQYFPKGTDFNNVPHWVFEHVEHELNERPRKVIDFQSPKEAFTNLVALET